MSSNKNSQKTKNKSKNILPLIGTPNQTNKKTKDNTNFKNEEQVKIELKGKNPNSKININQTKTSEYKAINENIEEQKINENGKEKNNYKIINSRNINNDKNLNPVNKTYNKNKNIEIINEIGKTEIKQNKLIQSRYKIIFVFRNEDFYISVKPDMTINNLRLTISKLINLDTKQISMIYDDKEIDSLNDYKTVYNYFNFKKLRARPIIYIKKKFIFNNNNIDSSNSFLFKKNFNNKVKITNFPSNGDNTITMEEEINNIVNNFFKNYSSYGDITSENNQYKIEGENENKKDNNTNTNNTYIIAFPSPDLAFDFNRYFNSLKLINSQYKDTKSKIISMIKRGSEYKIKNNSNNNSPKGNIRYGIDYNLDENDLTKRNSNILRLIRNNYLQRKNLKKEKNNSQIYVNISGPYLSSFEKERIEEKENKKKWINQEGFISCVGKYSGIQL